MTAPDKGPAQQFEDRISLVRNQLALFEYGLGSYVERCEGRGEDLPMVNALYGACETFARLQTELAAIVEDYFPAIAEHARGGAR